MDFSFIIPPGVGIQSGALSIWTNAAVPVASTDWTIVGPVGVIGRVVYATLTGGIEGTDYQLRWQAIDTLDNVYNRTALVVCAQTS